MDPKLRNMVVRVGLVLLGTGSAVGYLTLNTPQPGDRRMVELRDAGITDGQRFVLVCPERLTPAAARRIERAQPGFLRPRQRYALVARVAACFRGDGQPTNCFDATGALRPGAEGGDVIVPSLRQDVDGGLEGGGVDENGEPLEVDDSLPLYQDCQAIRCASYDAGDPSPFAKPFCNTLNRLQAVPPPCVVPNCWTLPDGGWDDNATVDCRTTPSSPWGDSYRGCNVLPGRHATGTACLPSACSVVAGDNPPDWL